MTNNIVAKTEAAIKGAENASARVKREIKESNNLRRQLGETIGGPSKHLLLAQEVTRKASPPPSPPLTPKLTLSPPPSPPPIQRARLSSAAAPVNIGAVHGGKTKKHRRNRKLTKKNRRKTRRRN
jgi:hypothetical protein